jgi:hypothetical protein
MHRYRLVVVDNETERPAVEVFEEAYKDRERWLGQWGFIERSRRRPRRAGHRSRTLRAEGLGFARLLNQASGSSGENAGVKPTRDLASLATVSAGMVSAVASYSRCLMRFCLSAVICMYERFRDRGQKNLCIT